MYIVMTLFIGQAIELDQPSVTVSVRLKNCQSNCKPILTHSL